LEVKHTRWSLRLGAAAAGLAACGFATLAVLAAPSSWLALDGSMRFIPANGGTYDWANSGAASPTYTCPAGAENLSGPGGLFNCGRFVNSTTPPIAPTLTPTAAAEPRIVSSVFAVDPIASDTASCGSGDPTTVSGVNGDPINTYVITTGSVPDKTELTNVYGVTHTRDDGHPEIFFAAERLVNNGESHIDFEFLQSTLGLAAGCSDPRSMTGSRTEGDLLVAVDFTIGGSLAGATIYQWHCMPEPGPQPPDGTVCDPPVANPTPDEHYEAIAAPAAVNVLVNAVDIPCGGWACRDTSGVQTLTVPTNDFLEGAVDLNALGFKGCFNTFLPHTRVSQSFSAQLADFTGPLGLKSCREPVTNSSPGGTFAPGTSVRDTATLSNGGAPVKPGGTLTFFLCQPAQVTATGCPSGTQVGGAKTLVNGVATSDPTTATNAVGKYCWRTVYAPDAASLGIYTPGSHTNSTTECFNVAAVNLPNTGVPAAPLRPWMPLQAFLAAPVLLLVFAWRRSRTLAVLVIAGVVAGSSPAPAPASPAVAPEVAVAPGGPQAEPGATQLHLDTVKAKAMGWRLVIPRIGIDAIIQSVGRDSHGAMASPSSLDVVGWYRQGPSPGSVGDAVIAGHFGLPSQPAVFRNLHLLRPGDAVHVIWPDGRTAEFRVETADVVDAKAHPAGLFARSGPARLSLITCTGDWDQALASYTDRLIVTAVPV